MAEQFQIRNMLYSPVRILGLLENELLDVDNNPFSPHFVA